MSPRQMSWSGLLLFLLGLVVVSLGGWRFETDVLTGRSALLILGYAITLLGIAFIFWGLVRSENQR
ncbi:MAG: hypothetical protein HY320_09090 [Armatimonadetes bacterium]|nr:hypothetical protein [Armatimonadota bacterium]